MGYFGLYADACARRPVSKRRAISNRALRGKHMSHRFSSQRTLDLLLRYGLAVTSVGLALLITHLLIPVMGATTSPLFFAAVMLAAWYGGRLGERRVGEERRSPG